MQAVRYRVGFDRRDGGLLSGFPLIAQALEVIWTSRLGEHVQRLGLGSNLRRHLAEDMTPALALGIYDDLVTAAHANEPEFRISALQLVRIERTGLLGLRYEGDYFPEGRFGNYELVEPGQRIDPVPLTRPAVAGLGAPLGEAA